MITPYVHLVQQETPDNAGAGPTPPDAGYQAIVAFEVLFRPYAEFRQRAWNPMMASHLLEAWDRQVHFIDSLHVAGPDGGYPPVFELRFINRPDRNQVEVFFLSKIFSPAAEQARQAGRALARQIFSLFPYDFALRPLPDAAEFERAYCGGWLARLESTAQFVEIRRFERLLPYPANGNGPGYLYLTHSWEWHPQSMDQVWCALAKYQQPLMLSVSLSPIQWSLVDYAYLAGLEAALNPGGNSAASPAEITSALRLYRELLYHTPRPFTMRVVLVGEPEAPRYLANAIGSGLCLPSLQAAPGETGLNANYALARPMSLTDLALARRNLLQLCQYDWGANPVDQTFLRLRYAAGAKQAQAAFRIPIPPDTGFPDVSLGREVE